MKEVPQTQPAPSIPEVVERFYNDYRFDCHSVHARFSRSDARRTLALMGRAALPHVAALIKEHFPCMETSGKDDVNWDLFAYIAWLIAEIRETHALPAGPYPSDKPYGEQDIGRLYDYCLEHGHV